MAPDGVVPAGLEERGNAARLTLRRRQGAAGPAAGRSERGVAALARGLGERVRGARGGRVALRAQ